MVKDAPYVMVAGSTWPPDEDLIINYFNQHPELKLIMAPHVVSPEHLQQIESKLQRPTVRYSQLKEQPREADCLLIDCYGLLSAIYRYAQIAYVGGGFGVGIHNVPEAAVYGIPVIIGPNHHKFMEANDLLANGGCFEVKTRPTSTQPSTTCSAIPTPCKGPARPVPNIFTTVPVQPGRFTM